MQQCQFKDNVSYESIIIRRNEISLENYNGTLNPLIHSQSISIIKLQI